MRIEATGKPIRYRLRSGQEIVLHPGVPTEIPDRSAKELLAKALGRVRLVDPPQTPSLPPQGPGTAGTAGTDAHGTYPLYPLYPPPDRREREPREAESLIVEPVETPLKPVYWESDGKIIGPGQVSHVAKAGEAFFLCVDFEGSWRWINSDLLRSRQAFDRQGKPTCYCCGGVEWWTSIHGARICSRCHPPMSPGLVKGEDRASAN
jgi:hypothetical protein